MESTYTYEQAIRDGFEGTEKECREYLTRGIIIQEIEIGCNRDDSDDIICGFSNTIIKKSEIPNGLHLYYVRGDDSDPGRPCTIEKSIYINACGTILSPKELTFEDGKDFIDFYEAVNFTGNCITVNTLIQRMKGQ